MSPLVYAFSGSVVALLLGTAACSGGTIAVGKTDKTDQELKTKKDGTPTGNGQSCSWSDTAAYDVAVSNDGTTSTPGSAPDRQYQLGEEFESLDGCNDCECTKGGIMCTVRSCSGGTSPSDPGGGCGKSVKQCPDGSYVGRSGPSCEFAACPGANDLPACTDDARQCPDGSYVGRTGPKCEFVCPNDVACAADAKQCPDGSYVSRRAPSCEFAPCP